MTVTYIFEDQNGNKGYVVFPFLCNPPYIMYLTWFLVAILY